MKLVLEVDVSELMGKAKEIDLTKLLEIYQKLDKGEKVEFMQGKITVQKKTEEINMVKQQ